MKNSRQLLASVLAVLCLACPWLNPFNVGPSVTVVSGLVAWSGAAGLGLCCITVLTEREARWRVLLTGWALAALLSAGAGLLQYFDRAYLLGHWVNYAGLGQAFGNLRQRNQFATLCSMGLVLLWWWAQYAQTPRGGAVPRTPSRPALTLALVAGVAVLCAAAAASGSRTGLLQLLLLLLLAWCWRPRAGLDSQASRGLRLVGAMVLAYLLAALLLPMAAGVEGSVFDRLRESPDGCNSRLALYRNVLYLIAERPLLGWGWGELDFAHFMTLYTTPLAGPRFCGILDNAHNLPLHWAVELGLPLALLLCALVLVALRQHRPWAEQVPQRQLAWGLLAMVGLHSLLEYPLWYGPFQVATALCLWVLYAYPAVPPHGPAPAYAQPLPTASGGGPAALRARRFRWCAVPLLALCCATVGWNYWRMSQLYMPPERRAPAFREDTYDKVLGAWFFGGHVDFAVLSVTPVTSQTAPYVLQLGERLLHFSPEASVITKLLDAAVLLRREDKIALYAPRFAAAFAQDYQHWRAMHPEILLPLK